MKRVIYLALALLSLQMSNVFAKQKNEINPRFVAYNPLYEPSKGAFKDNPLYEEDDFPKKSTILPIHFAAKNLDKAKIEQLLAEGADPSAINDNGITPLHFLLANAEPADLQQYNIDQNDIAELVRLFCSKGANVSATDRRGNTPLHYALKVILPTWEIVESVLQCSPDNYILQTKNRDGVSPIDLIFAHMLEGRLKLYDFITVLDDGSMRNARRPINMVLSSFSPEQLETLRAANRLPVIMPEVVAPERPEVKSTVQTAKDSITSILRRFGKRRTTGLKVN